MSDYRTTCTKCGKGYQTVFGSPGQIPNCNCQKLSADIVARMQVLDPLSLSESEIAEQATRITELEQALKARQYSDCPECGLMVKVDEDGCCVSCGTDAMVYCRRAEDTCPNCAKYEAVIAEVDIFFQSYQGALPTLGDIIAKAGDLTRRPASTEKWTIRHPGGMGKIDCDSFGEAMKWYEGFNVPTRIVDGVAEDVEESIKRVEEYHRPASTTEGE